MPMAVMEVRHMDSTRATCSGSLCRCSPTNFVAANPLPAWATPATDMTVVTSTANTPNDSKPSIRATMIVDSRTEPCMAAALSNFHSNDKRRSW